MSQNNHKSGSSYLDPIFVAILRHVSSLILVDRTDMFASFDCKVCQISVQPRFERVTFYIAILNGRPARWRFAANPHPHPHLKLHPHLATMVAVKVARGLHDGRVEPTAGQGWLDWCTGWLLSKSPHSYRRGRLARCRFYWPKATKTTTFYF